MKNFRLQIWIVVLAAFFCWAGVSSAAAPEFESWLLGLKQEALAKGIRPTTLETAFDGLQPIPRVIELDRKQPEFTQTFWRYLDNRVTPGRIARGRELLKIHHELLGKIARQYGVQPRFLVAFWGLETNFGDYLGSFSVVGSLSTLAYDTRRSDFFRNELLDALTILDQGHITVEKMQGSWAGAMGQPQFMPSTFVNFAVDQSGDGRIDIWQNLEDVFGSAANFLAKSGWDGSRTWGREVRLPADFNLQHTGMATQKPIGQWQKLGVRSANGRDLPGVQISGSIIIPGGHKGPAFLVYNNYRTILRWNRSHLYAIAVGHLSDRLDGMPQLAAEHPDDEIPLSREQVLELQALLNEKGFAAGEPDGVIGSQTRQAIKDFQQAAGLPADGYPSFELLGKISRTQ